MLLPTAVHDMVRLVEQEAQSARPHAPVVSEPTRSSRPARLDRARLRLGLVLRHLADRIEPACRPAPAVATETRR